MERPASCYEKLSRFTGVCFLLLISTTSLAPPTITSLTITLLVPRPRPGASKLLRFTSPVIRHQQRPVIPHQRLLQLVLRILVHVLLIVGHYGFGDGLADGVDLGSVATAGDADTDVNVGEFVKADDEEGFVDLSSQCKLCETRGWGNVLGRVP